MHSKQVNSIERFINFELFASVRMECLISVVPRSEKSNLCTRTSTSALGITGPLVAESWAISI